MALEFNKQETAELVPSLQKYFREEFEEEIGEMRAKFVLEYILKEIAPLAYNQGVRDAQEHFRRATEDVSGACFEPPLTYWLKKKK